jgi:multiple sugar transport system permease protein
MRRSEGLTPYLFLLPAVGLLAVFNLYPIVATIAESFFGNSLNLAAGKQFVGLRNFLRVLSDPVFLTSLNVTLIFTLIINPLQTAAALALALLANQRVRGISIFRSVLLLPVAVSINVTAIVWGLMLDQNNGIINGLLATIGLGRQPFLGSADQALWSIILIMTWKAAPFYMLFFLAGLQNIPREVVEASEIDGANRRQTLWHVILPMLRPLIVFVLIVDTIGNLILFVPVYLLTNGGPRLSTNLLMYETYRRGFVYGDIGAAAAMLTLLLAIVGLALALQVLAVRITRKASA